jgi:hypothetical protein
MPSAATTIVLTSSASRENTTNPRERARKEYQPSPASCASAQTAADCSVVTPLTHAIQTQEHNRKKKNPKQKTNGTVPPTMGGMQLRSTTIRFTRAVETLSNYNKTTKNEKRDHARLVHVLATMRIIRC